MRDSSFEAFNARDLQPAIVARSFVPFGKYDELIRPSHSLLIGPRGSGKTTLLKMLNLEALRSWDHSQASWYRRQVDYTGIFVPADITWGEMVDALANEGHVPRACADTLGEVAFGINVLIAATDAMAKRLDATSLMGVPAYRQATMPADPEELVQTIADTWQLKLRSLSFRGIAQALSLRLSELYAAAKRFSHAPQPSMDLLYQLIPYADLDIFVALIAALEAFDHAIGEPNGRWAMLLDEFEVVPVHVQRTVIARLRASPAKMIFKVALAPCGPQTQLLLNDSQPSPLDDVSRIELWYRDKNEVISFCRQLFESRVAKHSLGDRAISTPEEMLGRTTITEEPWGADDIGRLLPVASSSRWAEDWSEQFLALAGKDPSFKNFLREKGIDATDLQPSPNTPNGNTIRKIAPVVAFRNAYRSRSGGRRGRKPYIQPYVGWEAVATISEGNPRWFIGMLAGLERELAKHQQVPISAHDQWKQVSRAMGAFLEKLKTVAIEKNMGISTQQSVYRLLSSIGESIHRELIAESFSEDPPATFVVDRDVSEDDENCLRIALNFGGIVCYDTPDHVAGYRSLRGKRFRLAYILSPAFKLPLRSGKSRNLSTLLAPAAVMPAMLEEQQGNLW